MQGTEDELVYVFVRTQTRWRAWEMRPVDAPEELLVGFVNNDADFVEHREVNDARLRLA